MINYGIVGTGYFGADLARSINKIEDAKVIAVFDPNHAEEIAEELEAETCSSLDDLVARNDIDCVSPCRQLSNKLGFGKFGVRSQNLWQFWCP